jgi:hypothetical protein
MQVMRNSFRPRRKHDMTHLRQWQYCQHIAATPSAKSLYGQSRAFISYVSVTSSLQRFKTLHPTVLMFSHSMSFSCIKV